MTPDEINRYVKYSLIEGKYLVLALDGATVIGRSYLKETGIAMFKAYYKARAKLVKDGKISGEVFHSAVHGKVKIGDGKITDEMDLAIKKTDVSRKRAGTYSEGNEDEESNVTSIFKRRENRDT